MDVKFTKQADDDIIDCYLYGFLNFGQDQANRYEQSLRHVMGIIANNLRIAPQRQEYSPPVRIHHQGKHYIVYLIEADHILIVRVLRNDIDLTRHF